MLRKICFFAALIAALALVSTGAEAKSRHRHGHHHHGYHHHGYHHHGYHHHHYKHRVDRRIRGVALAVGAASTATYFGINNWRWKWNNANSISSGGAYALTTIGCMAASPIVATLVVNRPLTMREAHVLTGSCIVPIIGGWIVNKVWDAHPEWEQAAK